MGAGEINEETEKQLAEARAELRTLRDRIKQLEDDNTALRESTT